jgi:hypothetical protein
MILKWTVSAELQRRFINGAEIRSYVQQLVYDGITPMDCGQEFTKPVWVEERNFETDAIIVHLKTFDRQPPLTAGV